MVDSEFSLERCQFVEYLRKELIGPAGGEDEVLSESPAKRYLMGTLYPRDMSSETVIDEEDDRTGGCDSDEVADSPLSLLFQRMPASVGLSFVVEGESDVRCEISAAGYKAVNAECDGGSERKSSKTNKWERYSLSDKGKSEIHVLQKPSTAREIRITVLSGRAELHAIWRSLQNSIWLVTVSLVNLASGSSDSRLDPADCLFQVSVRCVPFNGSFAVYPNDPRLSADEEEEELSLIFSKSKVFAVGHGCAAVWESSVAVPSYVMTEFLPAVEVKPATTKTGSKEQDDAGVLRLQYLADNTIDNDILYKQLLVFVAHYQSWFDELRRISVPHSHKAAANRILERISEAILRMREGAKSIVSTSESRTAFALANRVMLMQMVHSGDNFSGLRRKRDEKPFVRPDYGSPEYHEYRWRPFQLAFQLLVVGSLVDEESKERDLVDLLWFPTGGGKTEAYLALAAFELIHRRLVYGSDGGGTGVIKRYTLRLLTSQQFQRASALICALESIRREQSVYLGEETFSLGLWVGGGTSPNKYTASGNLDKGAYDLHQEMLADLEPENPFQLQQCPWCGTCLIPETREEDEGAYGIRSSQTSFSFFCPTKSCDFHDHLPISVVDEDLYQHPPSMIIGTVDKFARLTWDNRTRAFFGVQSGQRAPSLIIQDELHLISGPLGTIAGVYEAAIDSVITSTGVRPKIIAATATIRRAGDQVRALFGRDVKIFPPSGLSADDSYFARQDDDGPGRLYIGVMGQGHSPMTALVQTAAALSQGVAEVPLSIQAIDAWWTQLIYHNSRRELGKTLTLARDDIPARVKVIASLEERARSLAVVEELSANVKGARIPEVLEKLKVEYPSAECVDFLPCTNMISVGVDVSRLGLMLINGQPKTTSEYIQASSRVGRDQRRPPGLVVTLYSATKPRDRSHYENFVSYHSALYRWVEPTSITPFAPPARDRALHASLVAMMRLASSIGDNDSAGRFDPDTAETKRLIGMLVDRMIQADSSESGEIEDHVRMLIEEWRLLAHKAMDENRPLRYSSNQSGQFLSLLTTFEATKKEKWEWPTLNSMRNVDQESRIRVMGEPRE